MSTTAISGGAVSSATASASTTVATASAASAAISTIDSAIDKVNTDRATYGAAQVRFEGVIGVLQISRENQTAAASRILDADFDNFHDRSHAGRYGNRVTVNGRTAPVLTELFQRIKPDLAELPPPPPEGSPILTV